MSKQLINLSRASFARNNNKSKRLMNAATPINDAGLLKQAKAERASKMDKTTSIMDQINFNKKAKGKKEYFIDT